MHCTKFIRREADVGVKLSGESKCRVLGGKHFQYITLHLRCQYNESGRNDIVYEVDVLCEHVCTYLYLQTFPTTSDSESVKCCLY